jgi:hypothetical protein
VRVLLQAAQEARSVEAHGLALRNAVLARQLADADRERALAAEAAGDAHWMAEHLDDARLLLLYHRDDFGQGEWPGALERRVALQAQRVDACYEKFARDTFGEANPEQLRIAQFVLADVPKAAVSPHLRRRESPPSIVDELIRLTYRAIVQGRHATNRRNRAGKK